MQATITLVTCKLQVSRVLWTSPVMQNATQFTPEQLIVAGRRAEAQGQTAYALQFYRYLADHFGNTTEAFEARDALYRLTPVPVEQPTHVTGRAMAVAPQPIAAHPGDLRTANGADRSRSASQPRNTAPKRQIRQDVQPASHVVAERGYRIGRFVAMMLNVIGWLLLLVSVMAGPAIYAALNVNTMPKGAREMVIGYLPFFIGGALSTLMVGLFAVFAAQVARATFDNADMTRWMAQTMSAHADGHEAE
jgi:hypothetical protein